MSEQYIKYRRQLSKEGLLFNKGEKHFAQGLNLYKIFWIFTIGSLMGFVVETLWCFFRMGHFEFRSGLLFGPFTPIYGIGAVSLYLGLYRISRTNKVKVFTFGVVCGTVIEYVFSFLQETVFGTISWDYSMVPFNLNGRVCLLYSLFWGFLAIVWILWIQPVFEGIIENIPNHIGIPLTWGLLGFFIFNGLLSAAAVIRWTGRIKGFAPKGILGIWIDRLFSDAYMIKMYPNLIIL